MLPDSGRDTEDVTHGSLPDSGKQWPPAPFDIAARQFAIWDAWYSSDTDALSAIYEQFPHYTRPSQYAGGLVGRVARFFWGRPNLQASKRIHVPIAADIARHSADLLFSQPPQFLVSEEDVNGDVAAAQKRLDEMLAGPETVACLAEAAETAAALGGVFLRAWWDTEIADHVLLGSVPADAAIPTWRYGRLVGATFFTAVERDAGSGDTWWHLEHHGRGYIEHGLFKGSSGDQSLVGFHTGFLGRRMPLAEHPATEWAASLVDERSRIYTGIRGLTCAYVPNIRPTRLWRNSPGLSPLGRSDYAGLEPLFDALDEVMSAWMRDVEMAKARLFVDPSMTAYNGPGKGSVFDVDQAIYTPLPGSAMGALRDGQPPVIPQQFEIRWNEHRETALELVNTILRGAGQSASTFGDDRISGTATATEINARDRLSERTRDKKIGYWRSALGPLSRAMADLDREIFGTNLSLVGEPEVKFPTRTQVPVAQMAATIASLRTANAISIRQSVLERNPNWADEQIDAEVARIADDAKAASKLSLGEFGDPAEAAATDGAQEF